MTFGIFNIVRRLEIGLKLARFVLALPLEIMGASKELRAEHERMKELAKELTE